MNAFLILVLLLTIAYIIYYGIVASQDIIAAKKSGESTVETIEVSSLSDAHVRTVEVHETSQGFRIGDEETKISTSTACSADIPGETSDATPAEIPGKTPKTNAGTTAKVSDDTAETKDKMESAVLTFSIDHSAPDYSLLLEGTGARLEQGVYKPKDGDPVIISFVTPEASVSVAAADENENILEDNSPKVNYDEI